MSKGASAVFSGRPPSFSSPAQQCDGICSTPSMASSSAGGGRGPPKRLIIHKYIGHGLLLFNALYGTLLYFLYANIAALVHKFWPFALAYSASMGLASVGLKLHRPALLWPMLILKIPLVLISLAICLLFSSQLLCAHLRITTNHSITTGNSTNFECPPGLFHRLEAAAANAISDFANANNGSLANNLANANVVAPKSRHFSALILLLIAIEKAVELVFFRRLMRKIADFVEAELVEMVVEEEGEGANGGGANGSGGGAGPMKSKQKRKRSKRWPRNVALPKGRSKESGGIEIGVEERGSSGTEEEELEEGEETIYERGGRGRGGMGKRSLPLPVMAASARKIA